MPGRFCPPALICVAPYKSPRKFLKHGTPFPDALIRVFCGPTMSEAEKSLSTGQGDAPVPSAPEGRKKRILLIEDQGPARLTLWEKFRNAGFEIDQAVNGIVAMEKLRTVTPDAIFMDLLLPYIKGVDVIKEARRDPKFANAPIYVCTSAAMMAMWKRRGTRAGATKVFDRGATPIDDIIAEVAADLRGVKLKPINPAPPQKPVTEPPEKISPKEKPKTLPLPKVTKKPEAPKESQPGTATLPAKLVNSTKFLKGFSLRKKKDAPPQPPPPVKQPAVVDATTATATPSTPASTNAASPAVPSQVFTMATAPKSADPTSNPKT